MDLKNSSQGFAFFIEPNDLCVTKCPAAGETASQYRCLHPSKGLLLELAEEE